MGVGARGCALKGQQTWGCGGRSGDLASLQRWEGAPRDGPRFGRAWESVADVVCVEVEVNISVCVEIGVEVKFGLGWCAGGSAAGSIGGKLQVAEDLLDYGGIGDGGEYFEAIAAMRAAKNVRVECATQQRGPVQSTLPHGE